MDSSAESFQYSFKIVLVGDSGVGKSCLSSRFVTNQFLSSPTATVAAEYYLRSVEVQGQKVKLHIWDTAGHERFRPVMPNYFRRSDGVVLVYDCTDRKSFAHVETYVRDVQRYAAGALRTLVANKSDVRPWQDARRVDSSEGMALANRLEMSFFETSAKTGENVENMFVALVTAIKSKYEANNIHGECNPFILDESFATPRRKRCC